MSRQRPRESAVQEEVLTETTAQRGEFVDGVDPGTVVCTTDRIKYETATGDAMTIAYDDIVAVRTFSDESLTGFSLLGHLFSFVALFFSVASVKVFLAGTPLLSVAGLGTYLSTAAAYPTAWMFYRMEVGAARVLRVETEDERFDFFSQDDDCGFDRVVDAIDTDRT